jgi:hypothetical protein
MSLPNSAHFTVKLTIYLFGIYPQLSQHRKHTTLRMATIYIVRWHFCYKFGKLLHTQSKLERVKFGWHRFQYNKFHEAHLR